MKNSIKYDISKDIFLKRKHGSTYIYVCGDILTSCKYLLMNIPETDTTEYDRFESINEIMDYYDDSHETKHNKIDPKTEFWGHCSNIEAWYENGCDWRLLDTNLSLPIIKKILVHYIKEDDAYEFRQFFLKVIESLDDYIEYVDRNMLNKKKYRINLQKFDYLNPLFMDKKSWVSEEEVEASTLLSELKRSIDLRAREKRMKEIKREKYKKRKKNRNYYERKIWASSNDKFDIDNKLGCDDWLEYRRLLRRIRNGEVDVTSDFRDYLPYLFAKGKFIKFGNTYLYNKRVKNKIIYILRINGEYYQYVKNL